MDDLSGFPFAKLHLDKRGGVLRGTPTALAPPGVTDVVVLVHGWKNDEADADALYGNLLRNVGLASGGRLHGGGRQWAAVGAYWPAFRFREDLTLVEDDGVASLPGATSAGAGVGVGVGSVTRAELDELAGQVGEFLGTADPSALARCALDAVGGGGSADAFLEQIVGLLSDASGDGAAEEHAELFSSRGRDLHAAMGIGGSINAASPGPESHGQMPAGSAMSFESFQRRLAMLRSGGAAAIARILNQATYFEMKARASVVGRGIAAVVASGVPSGVRVHMVGHSFGGRAVTAAACSAGDVRLESLTLLQAAFSHNGLGTGFGDGRQVVGAFRSVIEDRRVRGPIVVTHTLQDRAVGLAYAIASAATGVIAAGVDLNRLIGGPRDPHGGMGANGAQSMREGEAVAHAAVPGASLALHRGVVNNVLSDGIIGNHNDVDNEEVGRLVWTALSSS